MPIVRVTKDRYTVDSLYQWDVNQVLKIYGLSLSSIPEIHFTNGAMDRAIVRQATMSSAGVISVGIPNSLLQKPYKITAFICVYDGDTFESLYKIVIPVEARNRPADYTIEDTDGEVYSFKALENKIENLIVTLTANTEATVESVNEKCDATVAQVKASNEALESAVADKCDETVAAVGETCNAAVAQVNETREAMQTETEEALGSMVEKVAGATEGNFAGLDADGNVTDSGKSASDFAKADEGLIRYDNADDTIKTVGGVDLSARFVKIVAGTYEGKGGYGSENPTSISFDFVPKIVFISGCEPYIWGDGGFSKITDGTMLAGTNHVTVTTDENGGATMSWYNNESASDQLSSGTYRYVAIG